MSAKQWNDQPDDVLDATPLFWASGPMGYSYEVRKHDEGVPYYITMGNLLGSQTIEVWSPDEVIVFLGTVIRGTPDKPVEVPEWAKLLDNATKEAT